MSVSFDNDAYCSQMPGVAPNSSPNAVGQHRGRLSTMRVLVMAAYAVNISIFRLDPIMVVLLFFEIQHIHSRLRDMISRDRPFAGTISLDPSFLAGNSFATQSKPTPATSARQKSLIIFHGQRKTRHHTTLEGRRGWRRSGRGR